MSRDAFIIEQSCWRMQEYLPILADHSVSPKVHCHEKRLQRLIWAGDMERFRDNSAMSNVREGQGKDPRKSQQNPRKCSFGSEGL